MPAPGDNDELGDAVGGLEGLRDGDDRGGLSLVALPAADLERKTMTVDQQAHDDLGVDPPVLGVTHPPQIILTLGLEVQGGHVIQAQGQTPTGGDVLEQSPRQALAVAPLPAASQGAEQGPGADRLQAQVTQDAGDLGLGRRLDQTRQNHLLKGPIHPQWRSSAPDGCRPRAERPTAGPSAWTPTASVPTGAEAVRSPETAGGVGVRSRASWSGAMRCRPISIRAASSASMWADPRCSITLSRRPSLTAICTAVAPEAVLTLRRNGLTTPTLPAP